MGFLAGVTQPSWLTILRTVGYEGEVNFWRPGQEPIAERHYGKPFVFVVKGPEPRKVVGYGIIVGYQHLSVTEAWDRWGTRNGVSSLDEFKAKLQRVVKSTSGNGGGGRLRGVHVDETRRIGCLILKDCVLLPLEAAPTTDEFFSPRHGLWPFPKNTVKPMGFEAELPPIFPRHTPGGARVQNRGRNTGDLPAEARRAIEDRATAICVNYFNGWHHRDVSESALAQGALQVNYPGFDSVFTRGSEVLNVEIKGTTSSPAVVKVTDNELRAALRDGRVRLFVVSGIILRQNGVRWLAEGGIGTMYQWRNLDGLRAVLSKLDQLHAIGMKLASDNWTVEVETVPFLEPTR